ncbi:MAG: serine O-acetyltransferase [Hyphomicrobiaceae bacterium]|nr:serine O-acetyltransferase [Hyphomicrobiaceae bacterium]
MSGTASRSAQPIASVDPVWSRIRMEADGIVRSEPILAPLIHSIVLSQPSLEMALVHRIAGRLRGSDLAAETLIHLFEDALALDLTISQKLRADVSAVFERDPVCHRYIEPLLYFKGFQALQTHRFAHALFKAGRRDAALMLQSRASQLFQVDIHPRVPIGAGVFIDHGTGVVVGETARIDDEVSILQGVTLGGTGKDDGDRHPKIAHGVLIGAGAKVLGNIRVEACSRVAAGSVVLANVPAGMTVAGVPARIVGAAPCTDPALAMDQMLRDPHSDGGGI